MDYNSAFLSKGFHRQQSLVHKSHNYHPRGGESTCLASIWCLTKQGRLTEVTWRKHAVDLRVEQITVWDRLCADFEISISSDQYSKSKTAGVKKLCSSNLKKILFLCSKLLAKLYLGQCHSDFSNHCAFLHLIIYLLFLQVSSPFLSKKMRKANKPEPSLTLFSFSVL